MNRIVLTIAVLALFGVLAASVQAGGGMSTNIIQVSHPYYGGGRGGYHGGGYGGYHGGWNGYRVYYQPVYAYPQYVTPYPVYKAMFPPAAYNPYYYHPRSNFYYNTPRFSVGIGF